jgi:hypothetical protein
MPERNKPAKTQPDNRDKLQDLVPPTRERINQGQQFDELQRQQKTPDGAPRDEEES